MEAPEAVDLNLLRVLDVLLAEGSVLGAAHRLGLSPSAMSRTLLRLRRATGDPLLVRAGRALVPTPHAAALRARVHALALEAQSVLQPSRHHLDPSLLELTFTIRCGEWFMDTLAGAVIAAILKAAPRVRLHFVPKHEAEPHLLRDGLVDLEIGKLSAAAPEVRTRLLFRDRYVGVARIGHPLLAGGKVTLRRYAACGHVDSTQLGALTGPIDTALKAHRLARTVHVVVPGFPDAIRVAASSHLLALVPRASLANVLTQDWAPDRKGDRATGRGIQPFALPIRTPPIAVFALWHPRMDADPAHRWLRHQVISLCKPAYPAQ